VCFLRRMPLLRTEWRPQNDPCSNYSPCAADSVWVAIKFDQPTEVGCTRSPGGSGLGCCEDINAPSPHFVNGSTGCQGVTSCQDKGLLIIRTSEDGKKWTQQTSQSVGIRADTFVPLSRSTYNCDVTPTKDECILRVFKSKKWVGVR
jgi:hypothetical protein